MLLECLLLIHGGILASGIYAGWKLCRYGNPKLHWNKEKLGICLNDLKTIRGSSHSHGNLAHMTNESLDNVLLYLRQQIVAVKGNDSLAVKLLDFAYMYDKHQQPSSTRQLTQQHDHQQ